MEWGELKRLMAEFLYRVKRVSHVNRVSSKRILAEDSANFDVGKISLPRLSDGLFLFGTVALSAAFFLFVILINTAWASSITKNKVIELANADRREKGVEELKENEKLSQAAASKAEDMIVNNYFSHTSPEGLTPWRWIEKTGYEYSYAGENLAMDFTSAEKMNEAWLASPTHRANILNEKYKEIGVAAKDGFINGHATTIIVQMFGSGDKSAPKEEEAGEPSEKETVADQGNLVPFLPASGERADKLSLASPLITSPRNAETLNNKNINIVGRANPHSAVTVFDNGTAVGDIISDAQGWFRLEIKDASEGSHDLMATAESVAAGRKEIRISDKISFRVDREKPSLNYHLYADSQDGKYIVRVFSNKKNCYFELGGKKSPKSSTGVATFSVETRQSSIVAIVSDQAGNKTKKQIVLANYFAGSKKGIFDNLALSFSPRTALSDDSGRKMLAQNLGLVSHHFPQLADDNQK
ncbi:MAG: hypothetical protein A2359_02955 [Candidatus Moranbacteria bacterium RIFOXYB1_FULL_43_19]|nr:MAG: hypothetical protein A2359_02955 [Candidatus Moranbacteria bacterium RIFOXYB1_FULL_43_19]OGI33637.1 MAG: hypothetical protein A2420_02215 [Candidatus Moranbacteria bacterium RIFOXYC1_FULL_44_13]OGI37181.1 MAG: hypothetical protein A2612_03820 [Candidatus Moranbacteria bacterium RIFOXYD1_FULL_44_12]